MRLGRQFNRDDVARSHLAACHDDAHDPCLEDWFPGRIAPDHRLHQPLLKPVDLHTGVAKAGHLDHGLATEVQSSASRKPKQVDATRGDIFADGAGQDLESGRLELIEKLRMYEVDLP
jgi:hypothetical protein